MWYRRRFTTNAGVGAGANFQYPVKVYFGDGVDGSEVIANITGSKCYLQGKCRMDFGNIRFLGADGSELDYWQQPSALVAGVSSVFWVEVAGDMDSPQMVTVRYGGDAVSASNLANTFIDRITGVVLGLPMNEGSGDTVKDYSGNGNDGTITGATWVDGYYAGTKALQLNGTTDYIAIPHISEYNFRTNDFTLIIIAKMLGAGVEQVPLRLDTDLAGRALIGFWRISESVLKGEFYDSKIPPPFGDQNKSTGDVTLSGDFTTLILWRDGDNLFLEQNADGIIRTGTGVLNHDLNNPVSAGHSYVGVGDPLPHIGYLANMICAGVFLVNSTLSVEERTNIAGNFGDVTLEEGSCLVRKWAGTTQPSHNTWFPEQQETAESPRSRGRTQHAIHEKQRRERLRKLLLILKEYFTLKQERYN